MLTIPIYNMMLLPDVTFFFRKDALPEGRLTQENVGENILFLMLKDDKEQKELTRDDVYPIGISGKIESIDDGGNVRITAQDRVEVQDFEVENGEIKASAVIRPDVDDLPRQEEAEHFGQLKNDLLQFIRGFQWGVWARGLILQWKNLNETLCALSAYLNLTWEEKYGILETDSRRSRMEKIEQAFYDFM